MLFLGYAPDVTNGFFVLHVDGKVEVSSNLKRAPELDDAMVATPGTSGDANIAGLPVGGYPFMRGNWETNFAYPTFVGPKESSCKGSALSAGSVNGSA